MKTMKRTLVFTLVSCFCAATLLAQAPAQVSGPPCTQAPQSAAPGGVRGGRGAAVPRAMAAIPDVVAADAKWIKVWQAAGNSADGILADKDGSLLVAQMDYDTVLRIEPNDRTSVFVSNAKSIGSLSMDRQGRLYGAHRTERPGSTKPDLASHVNAITVLAPERRMVAEKWADGTTLSVRPNDLAADNQGGVFFTSTCVYYASPDGRVNIVADNIRTNGIVFSPDDKVLYVTNGATVVAFDVVGTGNLANRRDFATLQTGGGDGIAVDAEGRLYVTAGATVQVFDKAGKYLGLIPTPRGVISVAFAGVDKKTLYIVGSGAEDANGQPIREGPQQTAATIYKMPLLAKGVQNRAK